jgi:hypothetical protein
VNGAKFEVFRLVKDDFRAFPGRWIVGPRGLEPRTSSLSGMRKATESLGLTWASAWDEVVCGTAVGRGEAIGRHRLYSQRSASTLLMKIRAFLPSSPRYRALDGLGTPCIES